MNTIRNYINIVESATKSTLTEEQVFNFDTSKTAIITWIDEVLKGNYNADDPFYDLIVNTTGVKSSVGSAAKLGLSDEFRKAWSTYFKNSAFDYNPAWSQYTINSSDENTSSGRTYNFYVTLEKTKENIGLFINSYSKLANYLKKVSISHKDWIAFKTHVSVDAFIAHNDSLKIYYMKPESKDDVVAAVKEWISAYGIKTTSRTHEHGVDIAGNGDGTGSFGQILASVVRKRVIELIKKHGNAYTSEKYFEWIKQHLPSMIKNYTIKNT